jgi:hypothetical protein
MFKIMLSQVILCLVLCFVGVFAQPGIGEFRYVKYRVIDLLFDCWGVFLNCVPINSIFLLSFFSSIQGLSFYPKI